MNYVLIGNSTAAVGAIEGIRQIDRLGGITVISDEPYHTYSRPLISYWLAGEVTEEAMIYRPRNFYEINNVKPILGVRAAGVDFQGKKVKLADGTEIPYDKLLLATGGKPVIPSVEGLGKQGVSFFQKFDEAREIAKTVSAGRQAVVIGAGLIGLKAAEALAKLGLEVTIVELADRILPAVLDEQAASMVQEYLAARGWRFALNKAAVKVTGGPAVTGLVLQDGTELSCSRLIVAVGVEPNTDLVKDTEVKVNLGIVVNEKMETSVAGVYAAGDVCESLDIVSGTRRVLPLLPNAYRQGEAAGRNMAGVETIFDGGLAMNAVGFGDLVLLTAGIVRPDSEKFEVLTATEPGTASYRKVVLRDGCVVGYICLNKVDRAGVLTGLIKEKVDVSTFKERLLSPDFGYVDFPAEYRKFKLRGGAA